MNKQIDMTINMIFIHIQMYLCVMYDFTKKNETAQKHAERYTSGIRKLNLNRNEEKVSAFLNLYGNLLHIRFPLTQT